MNSTLQSRDEDYLRILENGNLLFMYTLIDLDSIDSTNSFAKREAVSFRDDSPTYITAHEQVGGRGRFGNSWVSPKDQNLYLTLAEPVRPQLQLTHYSYIATCAAVSVVHSFGITPHVKWPNDLLVDGKKICGILVEGTSKGVAPWAIVGIGLNVNMDPALLRAIDRPATSLQEMIRGVISLEEVRQKMIEALLNTIIWACQDPQRCQQHYLSLCSWMKGTHAVVQTATGTLHGTIEGFSSEGFLILRTVEGKQISVAQGVIEN